MNELNRVNVDACFKNLHALIEVTAKNRDLKQQTNAARESLKLLKDIFDNFDMLVRDPARVPQELHQRYELIGFGMCSMDRPSTVIIQLPNP